MYVIHQGNSMRSCEHSKGISSRGERDLRPSSGQEDGGGVFHLRRVNQATYHSFETMQRYWLTDLDHCLEIEVEIHLGGVEERHGRGPRHAQLAHGSCVMSLAVNMVVELGKCCCCCRRYVWCSRHLDGRSQSLQG